MKVLIVCSGNVENFSFEKHQAFIYDQVNAIEKFNRKVEFDYFFIQGKGIIGYLKNFTRLRSKLKNKKFDLIHSHFALSALLSNLQRKVAVLSTFHGSDINLKKNRIISAVVELLSKETIYVSEKLHKKSILKIRKNIIPCGVDLDVFKPFNFNEAKIKSGLKEDKKYILFSSSFDNPVKNSGLAKEALAIIDDPQIELLELKGFSRTEVAVLMSAVSLSLLTSFSEGSPQFIKEAMACNSPIVATNVGDIEDVIAETEGCYLAKFDAVDLAEKIKLALSFPLRTNGRNNIQDFDNKLIAKKVYNIYHKISSER